ncbi:nitroreductase family protein [Nocardioides bruguierae]|uniref:Nitroreductase family protein n=1 Tax=Nocardioides bruguierae TaxID=2945102 RepID=A0A9X2IE17_9ACTN|nr:nitroreductase family protein [Nocardioides bruguierae]MCL8023975.1 nitroreductase family protein [Nocardioides bruguierae]MCM0620361.1 nitroreductase family protein [Nocardioides bruguierae]
MEFREVVRRRRMVRDYSEEPVDPGAVERMLRHAVRAPSAGFTQGWGFVVLDRPADVHAFWLATAGAARLADPDPWLQGMSRAPVVVVPCSSREAYLARYAEPDKAGARRGGTGVEGSPWLVPYWHTDAAMAALLILQTAVDEGLGACFFGLPVDSDAAVRATLGLPDDVTPVGAVTVGHPAPRQEREGTGSGSPRRRPRRPLDEVVHRGRWGAPPPGPPAG